MDFGTPAHRLVGSLLIGAAVFVVAALWPLSAWAAVPLRRRWFGLALAITAACLALDAHAFTFALVRPASQRWDGAVDAALDWLLWPLFLAFPGAVCVSSAQSLHYAGVPPRVARAVALVVGLLAAAAAPFALIAAGCGLAGACF